MTPVPVPAPGPGRRPPPPRPGRSGRPERGSAAVELALLTPLLILLLLFVVACGRLVQTRLRLSDAAHAAARAASLARDPATATAAADATARAALTPAGTTCTALAVSTDTARFTRGGQVTVTLTCHTDLRDLTGLSLPGASTQQVSSTSPIDVYRTVTETP
jgi:Flp pilus assembly protein TadG